MSHPGGADDAWLTRYCAETDVGFNLICFRPDPSTTRGEGRVLSRLAEEDGWPRVMVVTTRPHISRARYILEQCFDGELVILALPAGCRCSRGRSTTPTRRLVMRERCRKPDVKLDGTPSDLR